MALLGMLLGLHNGYLALWSGDDPEPVRIYPYSARLLPPADRQALEKGIPVGSDGELSRLLEDFCS